MRTRVSLVPVTVVWLALMLASPALALLRRRSPDQALLP